MGKKHKNIPPKGTDNILIRSGTRAKKQIFNQQPGLKIVTKINVKFRDLEEFNSGFFVSIRSGFAKWKIKINQKYEYT